MPAETARRDSLPRRAMQCSIAKDNLRRTDATGSAIGWQLPKMNKALDDVIGGCYILTSNIVSESPFLQCYRTCLVQENHGHRRRDYFENSGMMCLCDCGRVRLGVPVLVLRDAATDHRYLAPSPRHRLAIPHSYEMEVIPI